MKLFEFLQLQFSSLQKPKTLSLPKSLQTLIGIKEIPHEYVQVQLLYNSSQLISKRNDTPYLQKEIWKGILINGNGRPQFIPLAKNQYGFESILIIGNMLFVFQMKHKKIIQKSLQLIFHKNGSLK